MSKETAKNRTALRVRSERSVSQILSQLNGLRGGRVAFMGVGAGSLVTVSATCQ